MYLLIFSGVIAATLYGFYYHRKKRREKRVELAESFGKKKFRKYDWDQIRCYHDLMKDQPKASVIDDATWDDLNLNELFERIDHTESNLGRHLLFNLIRCPAQDVKTLQQREKMMQVFTGQEDFRIDLQIELQKLSGFGFWRLPRLIFKDIPKVPDWYHLFLVIPFLALLSIILGLLNPIFFLGLIILPIVNGVIQFFIGKKVIKHATPLSALSTFLAVSEKINKVLREKSSLLPEFGKELNEDIQPLAKLKKRVNKYVHQGSPDNLSAMLWEYVDILFLMKINFFTLSVASIIQNKDALKRVYQKVGFLDAMISTASFKAGFGDLCTPHFTQDETGLNYEQMYHPLLKNPVSNSVQVAEKGILITGSNMSGKTTFIKTLGVNQILAQAFNFCCAERAEIEFCSVISSMRREDNLAKGKSFYLSEVERIKELIERMTSQNGPYLFLLDEIFRGTNTIERISASKQVLEWLKKSTNFVLASTHDLELVELLNNYEFYHFTEHIGEQNISFDYKLKPGYSSTKNALKLLEIYGYPKEVVDGAMEISRILDGRGMKTTQTGPPAG